MKSIDDNAGFLLVKKGLRILGFSDEEIGVSWQSIVKEMYLTNHFHAYANPSYVILHLPPPPPPISTGHVQCLWQIVAAVLQLGQMEYVEDYGSNASISIKDPGLVEVLSKVLYLI